MATAAAAFRKFGVDYAPDPRRGERTTIICIDERAALLEGLLLQAPGRDNTHYTTLDRQKYATPTDLRYLRTAAGAYGIGEDLHITLRVLQQRMLRRNSTSNAYDLHPGLKQANARQAAYRSEASKRKLPAIPSAHLLGSTVAAAAAVVGTDICTHKGCTAESAALPIGQGIADNLGKDGQDIREAIAPHWGRDPKRFAHLFQEIQDAYATSLDSGMIVPAEQSTPLLDYGNLHQPGGTVRAVPRVPLEQMDHISDTLIIDWQGGRTLDALAATRATQEHGEPWTHYYASIGSMRTIGGIILDHIVTEADPAELQEVFEAAAFTRNAATSLWLPEQQGRIPQLHTLN